ncbi:MAG: lysophospholipid acyltransferase family protein [Spirochaetaceae bacterium]|nr:lysophospholipid acyltransferase family protein [Spirochaetaceae bacterium]
MFPGKKTPFSFTLNLSKFLQARLNVLIFRFLPFHTSRLYLLFLGKIYYKFKKNEYNLIEKTIRFIFEKQLTPKELHKTITDIFHGIIAHYHEKLFVAYSNYPLLKKRFLSWVNITGEKEFQTALEKGKGVILVTAHYGAVEWLPGVLAARGYPVTMILRFQTQKLKDSLVSRSSEMKDLHLVDLDEGNVFFTAVNALKSGRILITECDEFDAWRPSKHIPITFLNQQMDGDKTLDILRKHSGAAVTTALMHRNSRKRYTLKLKTLITDDADKRHVSKLTLGVLDEALHSNPEQWYQWKDLGEKLELDSKTKVDEEISDYINSVEKNTISL